MRKAEGLKVESRRPFLLWGIYTPPQKFRAKSRFRANCFDNAGENQASPYLLLP
jgi:hypothetical protein